LKEKYLIGIYIDSGEVVASVNYTIENQKNEYLSVILRKTIVYEELKKSFSYNFRHWQREAKHWKIKRDESVDFFEELVNLKSIGFQILEDCDGMLKLIARKI